MGRHRRDYLKHTHALVHSWAHWTIRCEERSLIGFASMTVEGRLMAGEIGGSGVGGSKCPEVMMPEHVARVERAMRGIPGDLGEAVRRFYFDGEDVGRSKVTEALQWLSGRLGVG